MNKHTFLNTLIIFIMLISSPAFIPARIASSSDVVTSSIRYSQPDGLTTGDCLSWEEACTLQHALEIAVSGNKIWAMEGIYYPGVVISNTFQLKDGVAMYGGFPIGGGNWDQRDWTAYPTILSGDIDHNDLTESGVVTNTVNIKGTNAYHVVSSETLTESILDGFTITAGKAKASDPYGEGGGMLNNNGTITIANVVFSGNTAYGGGGMYNEEGTTILTNVTFVGNTAGQIGGGMFNNRGIATLTSVTFSSNQATIKGGGIFNNLGTATLNNVTFSGNSVEELGDGWGEGGGIYNFGTNMLIMLTNVTFSDNTASAGGGGMVHHDGTSILNNVTFSGNSADHCGGFSNTWGTAMLTNVTFSENKATTGGGMCGVENGTNVLTNVTFSSNEATYTGGGISNSGVFTLTNVTFSGNTATHELSSGGGMANTYGGSATLTNVTFYNNSANQYGGGIYNAEIGSGLGSHPILTNTILWGNSPDQIYNDSLSSSTVTYSDIQGGWEGEGNIDMDPLLGPLANYGSFTLIHALGEGSPAIDTGSQTNCPPTDQRGMPRPKDGDGNSTARCDMGSFEYRYFKVIAWLYLPIAGK